MISRTRFLQSVGALGATSLAFRPRSAAAATDDTILVVVAQVGGCDLLGTVIPLEQYGTYRDLRKPFSQPYDPALRLTVEQSALAGTVLSHGYALHPRMTRLRELYDEGRVGVVLGVGIPAQDPNRLSHEAARFDWQTASIDRVGSRADGWIAHGLRDRPAGRLPLMVATDTRLPIAFQSQQTTALALGSTLEGYAFDIPAESDDDRAARAAIFTELQERAADPAVRNARARAMRYVNEVGGIANAYTGADYPKGDDGELDAQFKSIARLIASGAGTRTYFAVHNGYDTHAEQNRSLPGLLGSFSDSIGRFYTYLQRAGLSSRVLILTTTDFGRRVLSDNTFGTDHGTASVNFLIGDRVRGGIYGEFPDLRKLDDDKNLAVPVDFRRVLATGAGHLGIELPDFARGHAPLGVLQ